LVPVGIGLLGFLKQFIAQRSRRATLDLFDDRGCLLFSGMVVCRRTTTLR
jgi:hypothetical protein